MLSLLVILLLAGHLLATNVAAAGPLIAAWLSRRSDHESHRGAAFRVAKLSLAALAVGGALGGVLLLVPNPGLRLALARFPASTYWFAAAELAFSAACMSAMVVTARGGRPRPVRMWTLAVASASNLLYHFPPLMAVLGKLASDPRWSRDETITHAVQLRLSSRPEIWTMWIHVALASVAVAAVAAMWIGLRHEHGPAGSEATAARLGQIALAATLLQLPVGAWVLVKSSGAARDAMLGQEAIASACFLGGVVAALALLDTLAKVALGAAPPRLRRRSAWLLILVAVLMSATLTVSRRAPPADELPAADPPAARIT